MYPLNTEPPEHSISSFKPKTSQFCVIVITWNEGERLLKQLSEMRDYLSLVDVIVIDGDSNDGSTEPSRLMSLGVRALLVTKELGLCTATRLGYAFALQEGYQAVITVDANGKDGVEALPRFVEKLSAGYDLVQGSRFMKGGFHARTPALRYFGIRFVVSPLIFFRTRHWYSDPTNAFRGCSRKFLCMAKVQPCRAVFKNFNLHHFLLFKAAQLKQQIIEIPVRRVYPDDGSIPTKIRGLRRTLLVPWELVLTLWGAYDPRDDVSS